MAPFTNPEYIDLGPHPVGFNSLPIAIQYFEHLLKENNRAATAKMTSSEQRMKLHQLPHCFLKCQCHLLAGYVLVLSQ